MNKEIKELKSDILKMHIQHVRDNKDHITEFEGMINQLANKIKEAYPEDKAKKELFEFMATIMQETEKIMSPKNNEE
jgi:hypothetical protein